MITANPSSWGSWGSWGSGFKKFGFRAPGLGLGVLHAEIASLGYLIQRFSEDFHRVGGTDPLTNKSPGLQTKCGVWDVVRL